MNRKRLPDLSVADLHENLVGDYRMGKTQSTHTTYPFARDFVFTNSTNRLLLTTVYPGTSTKHIALITQH